MAPAGLRVIRLPNYGPRIAAPLRRRYGAREMTFAESGGNVLFSMTAATYAGSLANYVASLRTARESIGKLATWLRLLALAFHTTFLGSRYVLTGLTEIQRREEVGVQLAGLERFWVFVSHPPYTNLFESLIFVTWLI